MSFGTQDKDFFPAAFYDKFRFIKEMGFDCFEADGKVLMENLDEIKDASSRTGIRVETACGGYGGWIGDFDEGKRKTGAADIKKILAALKEIGGMGIVVPAAWGMFTYRLPPMVSPRSREEDRKAIMDSLDELNAEAGKLGLFILLEPLNRYQDHMINLVSEARDIILDGGYKNVKITADFYHMNIEEDDMSLCFRNNVDLIGHIHIADNHRYQPGSGSIDFAKHFKTLKEIGYGGDIVYEGRVRGDNHAEEYRKSIALMKNLYNGGESVL